MKISLRSAARENYRPIVLADFVDGWERGEPFFDKTWKEVGVSTSMVYCIADEIRVGVMVMQDDILVAKHWPKNSEEPKQWVGYNVWGDHGFFYTSETMPHLAKMRVRPAKEVPEKRLMRIQDDRERTPFESLDWYELGDVLEAIEQKKAKTFKTCSIKLVQEQLRNQHITFYNQYADPPEIVKALTIHVSMKRQGKNSKEHTAVIRIISIPNALRVLLPEPSDPTMPMYCEADMYPGFHEDVRKAHWHSDAILR